VVLDGLQWTPPEYVADTTDNRQAERLLMSADEAAHLLAISTKQVRRLIDNGQLPARRIGTAVRLRRTDVEDFANGR
jgi:excisionase family DNA binding protein